MLYSKLWVQDEGNEQSSALLSGELGISNLLSKVLLSRKLIDPIEVDKFFNPSLKHLHDPFLLKDMDKAIERICRALSEKEKITVFGDYDVDGVTSTAIVYDFLQKNGGNVDYYIPDRIDEGYGLSIGAIDKIANMGTRLIITVDCGCSAFLEVEHANHLGIDVVITDHHECKKELPSACAVVNPCRMDCEYPFENLAGVGVVFKLINALCIKMKLRDLHYEYLDLVAIGTVADVVPLIDENRIIVKFGIQKMAKTVNVGILALIENTVLKDREINSWGIGYIIAPRINAAGRMENASEAVRLFITEDKKEASEIVEKLNALNKLRQEAEMEIYNEVVQYVENEVDFKTEKVIVVAKEGWHHGIIGIVASKIMEKYYRPCILISVENGIGKGSGRSIEKFNLFEALQNCEDLLIRFGGHQFAAGLSLNMDRFNEFKNAFGVYADNVLGKYDLIPTIKVDAWIRGGDLTLKNVRELEKLAPFGACNPVPMFIYENLNLYDIRTVGDNKHLKLKLQEGNFLVDGIGFNMGGLAETFDDSEMYDVVCSLEVNAWKEIEKVQLNIKDMRQSEDLFVKNMYFQSLEQSIDFDVIKGHNKLVKFIDVTEPIDSEAVFYDKFLQLLKRPGKIAVVINSFEYIEEFNKIIKKFEQYHRRSCRIWYTEFDCNNIPKLCIIVNAHPESVSFSYFESVVFYGDFADEIYLNKMIGKASLQTGNNKDSVIVYRGKSKVLLIDHIVPERYDFAAVYRYIRENNPVNCKFNNLFRVAKDIKRTYNLDVNYFKIKKCIEVFEELNLLKKEYDDGYGVSITMFDNLSNKVDIEKSKLYMKLKSLKA